MFVANNSYLVQGDGSLDGAGFVKILQESSSHLISCQMLCCKLVLVNCCCRKNGQDFNGSYFHRVRSNIEACACLQFSSATKASQACLAAKYAASPDTTLGVKAVTNGNLGLSLQQKIRESKFAANTSRYSLRFKNR